MGLFCSLNGEKLNIAIENLPRDKLTAHSVLWAYYAQDQVIRVAEMASFAFFLGHRNEIFCFSSYRIIQST